MTRHSSLTALAAALAAVTTLATSPASSQTPTGNDVSRSLTGATTTSAARSDSSNTHLKPTCNDTGTGIRTIPGDCSSPMGPNAATLGSARTLPSTTTLSRSPAQPVNKSAAAATTATPTATPKSSNTMGTMKSTAPAAAAPAASTGAASAETGSKGGAAH